MVQRAQAFFPDPIDVSIDPGTGEYTVRPKAGKNGKEGVLTGASDLPKEVYNDMVVTIVLNLLKEAGETVYILAFKPRSLLLPAYFGKVAIPVDVAFQKSGRKHSPK